MIDENRETIDDMLKQIIANAPLNWGEASWNAANNQLQRATTATVNYAVNPSLFTTKDFNPHQKSGTTAANAGNAALNWAGPIHDNGCPANW